MAEEDMMAYKDKALQRTTTRERVRRYRDRQKGIMPELVCLADVTPASAGDQKAAELKRERERGHKRTDVTPSEAPEQSSPALSPGVVRPPLSKSPLNAPGAIPKRLPRHKPPKMGYEAALFDQVVDADGQPIPEDG